MASEIVLDFKYGMHSATLGDVTRYGDSSDDAQRALWVALEVLRSQNAATGSRNLEER